MTISSDHPQPETTLAVILGAREFGNSDLNSPAFANSAEGITRYLTAVDGLCLPTPNVLTCLFDDPRPPSEITEGVVQFLTERSDALKASGLIARDLLLYYVGHGDKSDDEKVYFLFVKYTKKQRKEGTGLQFRHLREALGCDAAIGLRQYLIIDACFAARAGDVYQSLSGSEWPAALARELPPSGVSLLCSSSRDRTSLAPNGEQYTMFSGAILDVLQSGDPARGLRLTLNDLGELATVRIREKYPDGKGRRPEVHSPKQPHGSVANVPLFPNPASRQFPFAPKPPPPATPAPPRSVGPDPVTGDRKAAKTSFRKIESGLAAATERELIGHLQRLIERPDPLGIVVIFFGLGHSGEVIQQHAHAACHALSWDRVAEAVIDRAREGDTATCRVFLIGLGRCKSSKPTVELLDRLIEYVPTELSGEAESLIERKKLKLGLADVRSQFEAAQSRYRIVNVLGSGAVTVSYLAEHIHLKTQAVVRLLRSPYVDDYKVRRRFRELCQQTAGRTHEHYLHTMEFEELGPRMAYSVRRYIAGVTLKDLLANGKRVSPRQAVRILYKVVTALRPLHAAGLPHCGIRPANVYLCREYPHVLLGDASLILRGDDLQVESIGVPVARLTEEARYTAPEVATGRPVLASDFYALGCVAYELLCGRPPFDERGRAELLIRHTRIPPRPPSHFGCPLGPVADGILLKLLEKDPATRYQTIAEVKRALKAMLRGTPDLGTGEPSPGDGPPSDRPPPGDRPSPGDRPVPMTGTPSVGEDLSAEAPAVGEGTIAAALNAFRSMVNIQSAPPRLPSPTHHPDDSVGTCDAPHGMPNDAPTDASFPQQQGELRLKFPGYEILDELGRGGMGAVYRARDVRLARVVALKTTYGWDRRETQQRFLIEAQALAQVEHPNVIRIYEANEIDGMPYFVMAYIPGGTLAQKFREGPLPYQEAARLMIRVARAVGAVHRAGIIHRDIKPSNVLLTEEGEPIVSDFGLAKPEIEPSLTMSNAVLGTPAYMAPEQALNPRSIDNRADIYAIGAVLYEALTGRPPFKGETVYETIDMLRHQDPVSPRTINRSVPHDLEAICLKCLEKEPARRYSSAEDLADDLQRFLNAEPVEARRHGIVELLWKRIWRGRGRRLPTMALGIALAGIGIAVMLPQLIPTERVQSAEPKIELQGVRVESWTRPDGTRVRMVYADWHNVGDRPIRSLTATVKLLGPDGAVVWERSGCRLFAATAEDSGIGPGEEYRTPDGAGVVVPDTVESSNARIERLDPSEEGGGS